MVRERWIVVGTDFSDGAEQALAEAMVLADRLGARIALVHAYEDAADIPPSNDDPTPTLRAQLDDAIARAGIARQTSIEPFVRRGPPWEKLLNVAVQVGADLIVVGATGQRGHSSAANLLGSVAYRVVASSTRSVLISRLPANKTASFRPSNQIQK